MSTYDVGQEIRYIGTFADSDGTVACFDCDDNNNRRFPGNPEICDGLDNDCNGVVDDGIADEGESCATGLPGACAEGRRVCLGGRLECTGAGEASDEVCNVVDDDCDGSIDEDQRNACGRCGDVPTETCNGLDDDCDAAVDDDAPCPPGEVCRWGRCADPCVNNECSGTEVCIEGLCAEP
jgi:hypothetical protein